MKRLEKKGATLIRNTNTSVTSAACAEPCLMLKVTFGEMSRAEFISGVTLRRETCDIINNMCYQLTPSASISTTANSQRFLYLYEFAVVAADFSTTVLRTSLESSDVKIPH